MKRVPLTVLLALVALPLMAQQPAPGAGAAVPVAAAPTSLQSLLERLPDADFTARREVVMALAGEGSPAALNVLSAMLDGRLFYRLSDKLVVVARKDDDPLTFSDARTGQAMGTAAAAQSGV